jgi:hypothetical protein
MATNEFLANNVVFQHRPILGGTWKTIVCETTLSGNLSVSVNSLSTKCAVIKSVGEASATINGSAAANTSPTASESSLKDIIELCATKEKRLGRLINLAVGSVGIGDAVLIKGEGYFTEVSPSADADQNLTFDWTFEISGVIDTEESDES